MFAREFKPIELSAKEQQVLDSKLRMLGYQPEDSRIETIRPSPKEFDERGLLKPERYSKVGAKREISFNEHKLNALLARNTNLARKLAIDLSQNLVAESGGGPGFWKSFSEGVEDIRVEDGRIKIKLKK